MPLWSSRFSTNRCESRNRNRLGFGSRIQFEDAILIESNDYNRVSCARLRSKPPAAEVRPNSLIPIPILAARLR